MSVRTAAGVAFGAAAAVVAGILAFSMLPGGGQTEKGEVKAFKSYSQIERTIASIEEEEPMVYALGEDVITDSEAADGASAKGEDSHSDTYLQVEGVDEADIIKTDGEYIYYTSRVGYDVIIAKAHDGTTEEAAVITEEETGIIADDLYLSGDRLIIIGGEYDKEHGEYIYYAPVSTMRTAVCIYDVSNPEKPHLELKYRQSGGYVSSRLTGGSLYLITTDYLNTGAQRFVPSAGTGEDFEKLRPEQVYSFPEPKQRAYVVAGSIRVDGTSKAADVDTKAVLGASDGVYCNTRSIYFTDYRSTWYTGMGAADERTSIIRADLSKGSIDFKRQGSVRGRALNQFSMDEKDGYFRIATTAFIGGRDVNYLYVLDDKLEMTGKVKGFAPGEEIKAVRYIADMAYVITYEQTDPLFIIDLKDPENPEMLGSVEITGFSSLLVPEGEDMLLGIGMSTAEGELGEIQDGLKLALFDISDPGNPTVLDSIAYRDYSSDVQYDHRALTVSKDGNWYAVPYIRWDRDNGGVLRFRVSGGRLEEMNKYESTGGIDRCVIIGDYLYGLETDKDRIVSWEIPGGSSAD